MISSIFDARTSHVAVSKMGPIRFHIESAGNLYEKTNEFQNEAGCNASGIGFGPQLARASRPSGC